jgi:hypothetical protein
VPEGKECPVTHDDVQAVSEEAIGDFIRWVYDDAPAWPDAVSREELWRLYWQAKEAP